MDNNIISDIIVAHAAVVDAEHALAMSVAGSKEYAQAYQAIESSHRQWSQTIHQTSCYINDLEIKAAASHANGTYAALIPSQSSLTLLSNLQKTLGIPNPVSKDQLHMTLIYSRLPVPGIARLAANLEPIFGTIVELAHLPTQTGATCLVAKVSSDSAQNLHNICRVNFGATHDYASYLAHITLSYNCDVLPTLDQPIDITFDQLSVKPIEPFWT
jgi:hypothetical protein